MKFFFATALLVCLAAPGFGQAHVDKGAKIFIEPMSESFNTYLQAAFIKKDVPVIMVDDQAKADYVIAGTAETVKAGWAKTIFVTPKGDANASITVKDAKTGNTTRVGDCHSNLSRSSVRSGSSAPLPPNKLFLDVTLMEQTAYKLPGKVSTIRATLSIEPH